MVGLESSKQKLIDAVIAHKARIVKATNEIIERLSGLPKKEYGRETSLYIKKRVNQIISDLSIIGGFCGTREKDLIVTVESMILTIIRLEDKKSFANLMVRWCITVNGIIVDFTKTPFKFVGGEFKVNLRNLEGKIKTILKRE